MVVSESSAGHSVLAGTLGFRAQFSSAPTTGHLSDSWMIPFEDSLPIRCPAAYKGNTILRDYGGVPRTTGHVGFESWCERDQLMRLDFDPAMTGVASQPLASPFPSRSPRRRTYPTTLSGMPTARASSSTSDPMLWSAKPSTSPASSTGAGTSSSNTSPRPRTPPTHSQQTSHGMPTAMPPWRPRSTLHHQPLRRHRLTVLGPDRALTSPRPLSRQDQ